MLRKHVYPRLIPAMDKVADFLVSKKITAMHLSLAGLAISLITGILFAYGHLFIGAWVILVSGTCDMLDGFLARKTGTSSKFGAFIDSLIDRYADVFVFSGLVIHYARLGRYGMVVLVLAVILGAVATSYARARAENFIESCRVGIIERAERYVLVSAGGVFFIMPLVLWILAITTHFTVYQRIAHTYKELKN